MSIQEIEKLSESAWKLPTKQISNRYAGLKVLGIVSDLNACGHYRVINPLHMLKLHGADAVYSTTQNFNQLLQYDLIIAPRQTDKEIYDMLRALQWEGKHVLYECDDDLFTCLKSNPAYTVYQPGSQSLEYLEKFLTNMHGVTVTTPELAHTYSRFNKNIAILPNLIDFSLRNWNCDVTWNTQDEPTFNLKPIVKPVGWDGYVVVSWQGGVSHNEDLMQIIQPLKKILDKYDNVRFAYYGDKKTWQKLNNGVVPENKTFFIAPRHFLDHPQGLFGVDIGLAPVTSCEFNLSKSNLKILEGMAAGQAMIASNFAPYSRMGKTHSDLVSLVGDGVGCHSTWFEALEFLITNPKELAKRQIEGRKLITEEYSLENGFHYWPAHWNNLLKNAYEGNTGKVSNVKSLYKTMGPNDICGCGSGKKYKNCCRSSYGT